MLTVFVECLGVDNLADKSGEKDRRPSSGCRRKRESVYVVVREWKMKATSAVVVKAIIGAGLA